MLAVNEYFEGTVKSIGLDNSEGKSTIGAMEAGEYEFGTATVEYMTVISGTMEVLLPESKEWKIYEKGQTFIVVKDKKFKLKLKEQAAYHCLYK